MIVIHHVSNVSTSRLYGSFVAPPLTLTFPIVKLSRCQIRNSRMATPPQRIQREENDEARFFFMTYFVVRAWPARRHSATADHTCTTSATISTARRIQRKPEYGRIGSPMVRRCSAYSLNASWPAKALRLPYMCASTYRMKRMPLAAIRSLSVIVERDARAPVTKVVVATKGHATPRDQRCGVGDRVTYVRLPT